jgi:hypothetical protein
MKTVSWRRSARFALIFLAASSLVTATQAATYYVSPSGADANSGTLAAPFATLQKAVNLANPGDTIYMRGGTYALATQVNIGRNGSSGNYINLFNYPGEVPILDGISLTNPNDSDIWASSLAWWHFKGIELKNGPSMGLWLTGASNNNIIEQCVTHHNVRLRSSGGGAGILVDGTSANNLILNNDSHHNGNAAVSVSAGDGIGVNFTHSAGNIARGNRMWRNNDDGLDLWNAANVLVEGNWSWENGKNDSLQLTGGDGNGFKLGGGGNGDGLHTVRNNLAWRNKHNGFDDNGADLPMNVYNNIAYQNGADSFGFFASVANTMKNNLAFPNGNTWINSAVIQDHNSWNLAVTVSTADFLSLDYSGATGPRNADGSLPTISFLKLAAGSNLIDKGVNVGIAFSGGAPDLGAYEYGGSLPSPTGLQVISP